MRRHCALVWDWLPTANACVKMEDVHLTLGANGFPTPTIEGTLVTLSKLDSLGCPGHPNGRQSYWGGGSGAPTVVPENGPWVVGWGQWVKAGSGCRDGIRVLGHLHAGTVFNGLPKQEDTTATQEELLNPIQPCRSLFEEWKGERCLIVKDTATA